MLYSHAPRCASNEALLASCTTKLTYGLRETTATQHHALHRYPSQTPSPKHARSTPSPTPKPTESEKLPPTPLLQPTVYTPPIMPSATGRDWEKYKKFADEEEEEKKIVPLSEEYVVSFCCFGDRMIGKMSSNWL
jgi:hypothetical protein